MQKKFEFGEWLLCVFIIIFFVVYIDNQIVRCGTNEVKQEPVIVKKMVCEEVPVEVCYENEYIDDTKYPACLRWCRGDGEEYGRSYEYLCFYNCKSTKQICNSP